MKLQRVILKWFAIVIVSTMLLQFVVVLPAVSAQGEEPPTPTLEGASITDDNQDGMADNVLSAQISDNESAGQQFPELLSAESSQNIESISIGMVQTGDSASPRKRLTALGYSVTLIPPTAGLATFQQYTIVYLPVQWADGVSGAYQTIESHASDYQEYVNLGGGLFVEQPNPFQQPNQRVTPTLLPYPITFYNFYTSADFPPIIVDPNHAIMHGLIAGEMPFPADQMINIDPFYHTLVVGKATRSPSLVVGEYGTGRILVQTAHPSKQAFHPFSDEVYTRMIEWVSSSSVYDCSGYETSLSPIGQAVFDVVDEQNFCLNKYEGLTIIPTGTPPSGQVAFDQFGNLARQAKYEVDFTTMIWEEGAAGNLFLQGVKDLYDDVHANPGNYPNGMHLRILVGLWKYTLGTGQDQRVLIMRELDSLGVGPNDANWTVEVAFYRDGRTLEKHSHVKTMIVDGKTVVVAGYNVQNNYLNDDRRDMGVQVSGPIALHALKVFDGLWMEAIRCDSYVFYLCWDDNNEITDTSHIPAILTPAPAGNDVVFSLFRDDANKTADNAIVAAINAANNNVDIMQDRFVTGSIFVPPYAKAVLDVVKNQVNVKLLVSGDSITTFMSSNGICNVKRTLLNEDPSKLQYFEARFSRLPVHTKALSIDNSFIIVGSQNFDRSAWGDFNGDYDLAEYSLAIDSPSGTNTAANDFNFHFATEWNEDNTNPVVCRNSSVTLQSEIDRAEVGSIIVFPAGVYTESVIINKPLVLVGAGANQTIIQPEGNEPAFRVTSSDVTIMNMKISGGSGYGVELLDTSQSSLKNIKINRVVFKNNAVGGVLVQGLIPGSPMNYAIENNTFIGGADGVTINMLGTQAETSFIRDNIFFGQSVAPVHILLADDSRVEYSFNLFDDCALGACVANWWVGSISSSSNEHDNLFDLDPLFSSPENGAYQLSSGSPAIDAGDPSLLHDLYYDGDNDGTMQIDIGAFEYALVTNVPPIVSAGDDQTIELGSSVTVNASYSDVDNSEDHSARIDWGDGIVEDVPTNITGDGIGGVIGLHTYASPGVYTVKICVVDVHGGVGCDTLSAAVLHRFTGFFPPLDNQPVLNVVKAGSAIPVKFSLDGYQGSNFIADGYPAADIVACGSSLENAIEQTLTAGASSLSYDAATDQYIYVWKTDNVWVDTCRTFVLKLNDGSYHRADFKFKK